MRIIKFRAWHTTKKVMIPSDEMVRDQLTLLTDGRFINVSSESTRLSVIYDYILPLQFTGLLDKNGKEIYESDFVHFLGYTGLVTFDNGQWVFELGDQGNTPVYNYDPKDMEIVGNLYQDVHLLRA